MVTTSPMATFLGNKDKLTAAQSSLSGALSGIVTRAVVSPFDLVKIRFQLQSSPIAKKHGGPGLVQSVVSLVRHEGLTALWKGHTASQLLSIVYGVAVFGVFEHVSAVAWYLLPPHYHVQSSKPAISFVCGGLAGSVASVVSTPLDTLRTRMVMQQQHKVYNSTLHAFTSTVSREGMSGLFRGLVPNVTQVFPAAGIQFGSYSTFICVHNTLTGRDKVTPPESFVFGAFAGLISKTITLPFDFTKKRLQVQEFSREAGLTVPRYTGLLHCIHTVYTEGGITGFYRGALPSMLKAFISSGMTLMTFNIFAGLIVTRRSVT